MRILKTALTALGLAALLGSPAWAQRGGGFFGGPGALLSNEGVQKELKLDDKQVEEANKLAEELRDKAREHFQSTQGLEGQEREEKMRAIRKQMNEETNKALSGLLKPDQLKRYKQISLQQAGANAFTEPEIQSELKLTDAQKEKVREILGSSRSEMREIFEKNQGDRQAIMEKMNELRKETLQKALATLSADQKKIWEEKTGKPFQVKFEPRPR